MRFLAWSLVIAATAALGGLVAFGGTPRSDSLLTSVLFANVSHDGLVAAPIPAAWVRAGTPHARWKPLGESADGHALLALWDCTAGSFEWHFGGEETIVIVEGEVTIRDATGAERRLVKGDVARFPPMSNYTWTVDTYVRKVAILRKNIPAYLVLASRVHDNLNALRRWPWSGAASAAASDAGVTFSNLSR